MKTLMSLLVIVILLAGSGPAAKAADHDYEFLPLALDPSSGEFPEGIVVGRRGNIYFSLAPRGEVWRATPDGDLTRMAVLDPALPQGANGALGLAIRHGTVYAALMACNATACNATHGVWRIRGKRHKKRLPGTGRIAFPNALAFGRRGELYVSDSLSGAIWVLHRRGYRRRGHWHRPFRGAHRGRFRPAEIWIKDEALAGTGALGLGAPIGANGLAYSRARNELLVANTELGSVLAIPIGRDGEAGEIEVVAQSPALLSVDGIAVDRYGDVLALTVVRIGAGGPEPVSQLLHINRDTGDVEVVLAGAPLFFSTSLAFGRTPATAETVFVANWAVLAPMFGLTPEPAIVRIDLQHGWHPSSANPPMVDTADTAFAEDEKATDRPSRARVDPPRRDHPFVPRKRSRRDGPDGGLRAFGSASARARGRLVDPVRW